MPYSLPLIYQRLTVGHCFVDPPIYESLFSERINVFFPKSLRQRHTGRPDILLALIREDPGMLLRCHPYLQLQPFALRVSHIALRPAEILPLLHEYRAARSPRKDEIATRIRYITSHLPRIVFCNGSRVDCRSDNLRELSPLDHPFGDNDYEARLSSREDS